MIQKQVTLQYLADRQAITDLRDKRIAKGDSASFANYMYKCGMKKLGERYGVNHNFL